MPAHTRYRDGEHELYRHAGAKVRAARVALGVTQTELAEGLDLQQTEVSGIERGRRMTKLHVYARLVRALDLSWRTLFA